MSAEVLRRAASLMRERAEAAVCTCGGPVCTLENGGVRRDEMTARFDDWTRVVDHYCGMTPAIAVAVAKAMADVADAWEIADESADGYVHDGDDNYYPFEETVDGGWLAVARAYLGESP